jgi:SPP1 gp7 family putative phage head morphogenesis protein
MPLDLSRETRRDPTGAKQITDEYEARAKRLVRAFLERAAREIRETSFAHASVPLSRMSPLQFLRYIDVMAREEMDDPAGLWYSEMLETGYRQGNAFAGVVLGAPREIRASAWKKLGVLTEQSTREFSGMTSDLSSRVRGVVADGMVRELTQGEMIDQITALTDKAESGAERIVRTETMRAVNTAVVDEFRRDEMEYVEWLAAIDEKGCAACGELSGKVFPIDQAPPAPLHPNCRCTLIAFILLPGAEMPQIYIWDAEAGVAVEA